MILRSDCGTENGIAAAMQCNVFSEPMDMMLLQQGNLLFMALPILIKGLKAGGPFSDVIEPVGGLTSSRTWCNLMFSSWGMSCRWNVCGFVFLNLFKMTWIK